RPHRAGGAHRARVLAARSRARGREGAALGRRERRGEPRSRRRRPRRHERLRRRGADDQALARARARPRGPDQEAHLPHHDQAGAEPEGRPPAAAARGRREAEAREARTRKETDDAQEEGGGCLMGQKVHPGGMRVGVIHDWKSNWYTGKKEFPQYLLEDVQIRAHIYNKLAHAGLCDNLIRKDTQRITVDIYTARPGIVIGKSGVEVDALRKELHSITKKNVHININE